MLLSKTVLLICLMGVILFSANNFNTIVPIISIMFYCQACIAENQTIGKIGYYRFLTRHGRFRQHSNLRRSLQHLVWQSWLTRQNVSVYHLYSIHPVVLSKSFYFRGSRPYFWRKTFEIYPLFDSLWFTRIRLIGSPLLGITSFGTTRSHSTSIDLAFLIFSQPIFILPDRRHLMAVHLPLLANFVYIYTVYLYYCFLGPGGGSVAYIHHMHSLLRQFSH